MYRWKQAGPVLLAALLTGGCAAQAGAPQNAPSAAAAAAEEETVTCNGIVKKKSELSQDTLEWLEWYRSLPEEQQAALSFVPSEFLPGEAEVAETAAESGTAAVRPARSPVIEMTPETEKSSGSYYYLLTDEELKETEELARNYFTECAPSYGGVTGIRPAEDSSPLYRNKGIEDEYDPGNIIIYYVMTALDEEEGNPMRSISIARRSKSDDWKIINSGH